jgi:hypothetical protein
MFYACVIRFDTMGERGNILGSELGLNNALATMGRCHLGLQSSTPRAPPESTHPPCYRELGKPRCRRPQARAPTPPTALPSRTLISHLATPPRRRAAAAAQVWRSRLCAARSSRRASAAGSAADSSATPPPSPSASTPVSSKCDSFPCGRPGRRGWAWPPFPPFAACLSRLGSVRF